jgi:hypothetical protein
MGVRISSFPPQLCNTLTKSPDEHAEFKKEQIGTFFVWVGARTLEKTALA